MRMKPNEKQQKYEEGIVVVVVVYSEAKTMRPVMSGFRGEI